MLNPSPLRLQALTLIHTFFPEALNLLMMRSDWVELLRSFLSLVVTQNEIGLDLGLANDIYRWVMEEGYSLADETFENPEQLPAHLEAWANFLKYIPICGYGFGDELELYTSTDISEHPPFQLLKILLAPGGHDLPAGLREKMGNVFLFPEDWDEGRKKMAWLRLATFDLSLPQPFCWLPEMAKYACGELGNIYLDNASMYTEKDWGGAWYEWNNPGDLEMLQRHWIEAQPIMDRIRIFEERTWNPESLVILLKLVTGQE